MINQIQLSGKTDEDRLISLAELVEYVLGELDVSRLPQYQQDLVMTLEDVAVSVLEVA